MITTDTRADGAVPYRSSVQAQEPRPILDMHLVCLYMLTLRRGVR
jgi:hypothetical protein